MFTVTKYAANRFLVEGIIHVGGRGSTEKYERVFVTKKKADADAAKWTEIERRHEEDQKWVRQRRLENAREYLAKRAARPPVPVQLEMF